jgi:hypothetical protein
MKRALAILLMAAAWLTFEPAANAQPLYREWKPLFNGKDLEGWKTHPNQPGHWRVEEGAIVGSGSALSHLFAEQSDFDSFHLRAEARINAAGNSGIYFRSEYGLSLRGSYPAGYEAQICLDGTKEDQLTGSLYGFAAVKETLVEPNRWFTMDIVGDGRFIAISVNGKKVVDFKDEKKTYRSGRFAIQQMAGTTVAFRKFEVRTAEPVPTGSFTVIRQGKAPTCWIDASMAALLYSGVDLSKLVESKGNNRYAVKLHNWTNPRERPNGGIREDVFDVEFDGKSLLDADLVVKPGDKKALWAVVLQRGVIESVREWDPSQSVEKPHSGGAGDALVALTGRGSAVLRPSATDVRKKIENALSAGKPVVFGMNHHYYAVLKSTSTGIMLYDPYGSIKTMSWKEVEAEKTTSFVVSD